MVGGGNSAGQAAVHLSRAARSVRVVIRGDGLSATMSRYLVERIESRPNIEIVTRTEVSAVHGNGRLEHADLRSRPDGNVERVAVSALFVMIGADPCTEAVHSMLDLDEAGYITCGDGAAACEGPNRWPATDRQPHLLETVVARRLRRRRRPCRRDQARLQRGRRRRARRALRPHAAGLAAMPVVAIADIFGISGRRAELTDLLARTEQHVRALPGVRRYVFASGLESADRFVLLSEWDSQGAMDAYHRSDAFARYQSDLHGLLARPSQMTVYSVTGSVRPVPGAVPDPRDAD